MTADDERKLNNRIEEAMYGRVGTSDCHKVGIWGGCGLDCWVYQEGRCTEPDELIEGVTDKDDLDNHVRLYGSKEGEPTC